MRSSTSRLPLLFCGAALAAAAAVVAALTWVGGDDAPAPAAPRQATAAAAVDPLAQVRGADDRAEADERHGCLGAPTGSTFRYRLTDRSDFTLSSAEAGAHPGGRLHVECEVAVTVLDRRDGEVLVGERIDALRFVGSDGRPLHDADAVQRSLTTAAATPVFARLDQAGKVLGFGFADGLDGDQRNFLRGVLGVLHFPAPGSDHGEWRLHDSDTTGDYDARCEVVAATADEVRVRRTRLAYTRIAGHDTPPQHELRGRGEASFSRRHGWLASVCIDEGMTLQLPLLDLRVASERRAEAVLIEATHTPLRADFADDWRRATAPSSGADEVVGAFAAASERDAWRQRLTGVTLDQLLADLSGLLAAAEADREAIDAAFQRLQWLVRLDGAVADDIGQRIATRQLEGELAGVALSSLGAAGSDAAQAVLTTVRSDATLDAGLRQAATVATLQLEAPSNELVASIARDASAPGDVGGNALLVLGALAPRNGAPLADGRSPIETLLALEAMAAARGELPTWLLAVGNAAPPQTVAIVQRHLDDLDPAVRAAACVALRRVADPIVVTLLVERGLADADANVRREAVLVLGTRSEPAARAALQQVAQSDPDSDLRRRASDFLQGG